MYVFNMYVCVDKMYICELITGEDWKTARCLATVGSHPIDTRDTQGRETFIIFSVMSHLLGSYPKWYLAYDVNNAIRVIY